MSNQGNFQFREHEGNRISFYDPEGLRQFHLDEACRESLDRLTQTLAIEGILGSDVSEEHVKAAVDFFNQEIDLRRGITPEMRKKAKQLRQQPFSQLTREQQDLLADLLGKDLSMGGSLQNHVYPMKVIEKENEIRAVLSALTGLCDTDALEKLTYRRISKVHRGDDIRLFKEKPLDLHDCGYKDTDAFVLELRGSSAFIPAEYLDNHVVLIGGYSALDFFRLNYDDANQARGCMAVFRGNIANRIIEHKEAEERKHDFPEWQAQTMPGKKKFNENRTYALMSRFTDSSLASHLMLNDTFIELPKDEDYFMASDDLFIEFSRQGITATAKWEDDKGLYIVGLEPRLD
ncbi:MAG: hypothetical protein ACMXX5_00100 [Candidatus Woesearchaeota archaeon]